MKVVIQRVLNASVRVDGNITGKIKKGLLIFLGIESGDSDDMLKKYADKIVRMRIFEDENGKTNRALSDVNGELLIVSQFTLCADCSHGNRPSFIGAKEPVELNDAPFLEGRSSITSSYARFFQPLYIVLLAS